MCIYHAGCPDGFGAAWAVWRAWGDAATYLPRGHEDPLAPGELEDAWVVFVDIAPPPGAWRELGEQVAQLVVLDHHVSARDRFESDPELGRDLASGGHRVHFDLEHSGAVLAWQHFHPEQDIPFLLRYVEDQDLWQWQLPSTREVNGAIGSYPRSFPVWEQLAERTPDSLAREGAPIVRAQSLDVQRALRSAHPVTVAGQRIEAVNAREQRAWIGHELASRARFGVACGAVYRLTGTQVDVSLYSVGDLDVAKLAGRYGGGGHRNAAGFSVSLAEWLERFL